MLQNYHRILNGEDGNFPQRPEAGCTLHHLEHLASVDNDNTHCVIPAQCSFICIASIHSPSQPLCGMADYRLSSPFSGEEIETQGQMIIHITLQPLGGKRLETHSGLHTQRPLATPGYQA
jgi:hypothetical protein